MMLTSHTDDIAAVNQAIAQRIGTQKFHLWFKNSTKLSLADEYVKVGVPNTFIGSWIENHFLSDIQNAVTDVTGSHKKISFCIEPGLLKKQNKSGLDNQAIHVQRQVTRQKRRKVVEQAPAPKALKYNLQTFIPGAKTQLAYNAAKAVVDNNGCLFNPLFLHGGYGVGKTHLLQGICHAISRQTPDRKCIYVSAEEFTNQYVTALKTQKLEAFRSKFRKADVLAIDDIHFLANKPSTQEEFLHTFNSIDMANKQIILASDAHPRMIGQLTESLVSRFVSGMVIKMETADFETRKKICVQKAAEFNMKLDGDVLEYTARQISTNIRELEGALLKLAAYAKMSGKTMDLHTAQQVLSDHVQKTDPIVHISDIESNVANFFGVTPADLHSSKKNRTVSLARSCGMYLARQYTRMSFPEIGKMMGNKNHATVILACRKIRDLISDNCEISWKTHFGTRCEKIDDIIRQLTDAIACA